MRLGVALSGGGHKASAWGVGVLAAIVDAGLGPNIASVSSVSGGSIINGVIAKNLDLRTATNAEFDEAVRPALLSFARYGLYPTRLHRWSIILSLAVALGSTALVCGLVIVGVAAGGFGVERSAGATVGSVAVVVALAGWCVFLFLVARRGSVLRSALERTYFGGDRTSHGMRLADVVRPVNHVFVGTDLESKDYFFMSPRFLTGYRPGISDPKESGTTLGDAVYASGALPGALPPFELRVGSFSRPYAGGETIGPPGRVWLSDGSVTDVMASAWESGLNVRVSRLPELAEVQDPADILVVAGSAGSVGYQQPLPKYGWPAREVIVLARNQATIYAVAASDRRLGLLQAWTRNERSGSGQQGVIVDYRSPYDAARPFTYLDDERAMRAREAVEFLERTSGSEAEWEERARANASFAATLGALGTAGTIDLIENAYLNTLVNLYVRLGLGELLAFDRERFERLIDAADPEAHSRG